jgi:hypothetical protein
MNILALDIGKFNTVYCDYISKTGEHEFGKVKTTPQAIHDLIVDREPKRVVMEVCSIGRCSIGVNFTFAFLSPPGLLTKAAKADYGEIEIRLMS